VRRILVIGSGGSGKTTLAIEMGRILGLPVIHLDSEYWRPGWMETPKAEWRARVAGLCNGDSWVIDGNYGDSFNIRSARADTVVFLDYSRILCLWRVWRRFRSFQGTSRPDLTPGCPEMLDREFLWWIWSYPFRSRPAMLARISRLGRDKKVVILRSPREAGRFLDSIGR